MQRYYDKFLHFICKVALRPSLYLMGAAIIDRINLSMNEFFVTLEVIMKKTSEIIFAKD